MENDSDLQAGLQKVVLHKIDCEKGEGPELAKQYGIRGYPTFVMLNPAGEVVERWMGYDEASDWVAVTEQGRADLRSIDAKRVAYEAQPTLALARSLSRHAMSTDESVAAVGYLKTALKLNDDPARTSDYQAALFESLASGARGGHFTVAEVQATADQVMADPATGPGTRLNVAYTMGGLAREHEDPSLYAPYLAQAVKATAGSEDEGIVKFRNYLLPDHALYVEEDAEKALAMKREAMPEGWLDSADELNQYAWWCFERRLNLDEAEDLALKGVRLATDDASRANILDTAAEICNARGDCTKAVELIRRAIELDPDREYFQKQLARFEEIATQKS